MAHSALYIRLMNSHQWHDIRQQKLYINPFCEECEKHNVYIAAECVHHIVEIESGRNEQDCIALAYTMSNLQSLCFKCHNAIHTKRKSHSKKAHKERAEQSLERWAEEMEGRGTLF